MDLAHVPEETRLQGLKESVGTYVLIFELPSDQRVAVGKLGIFNFPSGWYGYAGSALGPGGLPARLRHHLKIADRPHWHMDYLRPLGWITEMWYGRSPLYAEHRWADDLRRLAGTCAPAPGFGSSDCRCETHLIRFDTVPDIAQFKCRQPRRPGRRRPPVYRLPITGVREDTVGKSENVL